MDACVNSEINDSESGSRLERNVDDKVKETPEAQNGVTDGGKPERMLTLCSLPDEAILYILSWVDLETLLKVACVNKHLKKLACDDSIWRIKTLAQYGTVVKRKSQSHRSHLNWKSIYKTARNWCKGIHLETEPILFTHFTHLLPWLQIAHKDSSLTVSQGSELHLYDIRPKKLSKCLLLKGHSDDIVRFVRQGPNIYTSSIDKTVRVWNVSERGGHCRATLRGHTKGVYCVDGDRDVVISGSKDETIKLWRKTSYWNYRCKHTIEVNDHIWCVCLNSGARQFLCGTAAYNIQDAALRVYDLQTGQQISSLGNMENGMQRFGAGILELKMLDKYTALSCGYDTTIRIWDIRINKNVRTWEDPHDNVVYCVESNKDNMILSGTNRYGVVRLWDKRMTEPVQALDRLITEQLFHLPLGMTPDGSLKSFFTGKNRRSSPVYSLQFSPTKLFVALSHSVRMLDFT